MALEFTDADLLVPLDAPMDERRAWNSKIPPPPTNTYIGQLKLLATEIAFLTLGTTEDLSNCVVVYAGAAGGHHIPALADKFRELEFYLYDPAPFAIEATDQLHIINGMFTDEVAHKWGSQTEFGVLFICDIRTSGDTAEEHESEVASNMAMQAHWVDLLSPALRGYSLKFRIPYTVIEANKPFKYLGGSLIYQPYPKPFSMELRLLGNASDAEAGPLAVTYDSKALEQTVFYHNTVIRPNRNLYANIFSRHSTPSRDKYRDSQFDNGYDCTYFLYVVKRYQEMRGLPDTEAVVQTIVSKMISITSQGKWTLAQRKSSRR